MKEVYVLECDNGHEYEQNDREIFAVCESYEKALEMIEPLGFESFEGSKDVFIRHHDTVEGQCIGHDDFVLIHNIPFNELKPNIEHITHHYKKRITKWNPYNVLKDNQYVKVFCRHCKNYMLDLNTLYKGNLVSSICSNCHKTNYPHSWIEEPILKNDNHPSNAIVYFDET